MRAPADSFRWHGGADRTEALSIPPFTNDELRRKLSLIPPIAPLPLAVIALTPTDVRLSWPDASLKESKYRIDRAKADGPWEWNAEIPKNRTACIVSELTPGASYRWRVRPVVTGGAPWSSVASVVMPDALAGTRVALGPGAFTYLGAAQLPAPPGLAGLDVHLWSIGAPAPHTHTPTPAAGPCPSVMLGGGMLTDETGATWSIAAPNVIQRNGVPAGNGRGSEILLVQGAIYVLGTDAEWWQWRTDHWEARGPVRPTCP